MIDQSALQTIGILLAGVSLTVAATYYTLTLRNNERTRKTQIFMQIFHQVISREFQRDWIDLMNMEWENYDDFENKYGSDNNPENYAKRVSTWMAMNGIGAMMVDGLIDPERLLKLVGTSSQFLWIKFKPIIYEQRARYGMPNAYQYFEQMAETLKNELRRQNEDFKLPETLTKYIPDP